MSKHRKLYRFMCVPASAFHKKLPCTMCGLHTRRFVVYPFYSYPRRVTLCVAYAVQLAAFRPYLYIYIYIKKMLFPKPTEPQCVYLTNVLEFFVISLLYMYIYIWFILNCIFINKKYIYRLRYRLLTIIFEYTE